MAESNGEKRPVQWRGICAKCRGPLEDGECPFCADCDELGIVNGGNRDTRRQRRKETPYNRWDGVPGR